MTKMLVRISALIVVSVLAGYLLLLWQPWRPLAWDQDFRGMPITAAFKMLGRATVGASDGESIWASPVNILGLSISARQLVLSYGGKQACVISQSERFDLMILLTSELVRKSEVTMKIEKDLATRGTLPVQCEQLSVR